MARMFDPSLIHHYALAGSAVLTLESAKTGARFTYKVQAPNEATERGGLKKDHGSNIRFVNLLSGPDNEASYCYMGLLIIEQAGIRFRETKGSKIRSDAISFKAFEYFVREVLNQNRLPEHLEVFHEGHCGRCGKTLTVPESIETGFGPECSDKIGVEWGRKTTSVSEVKKIPLRSSTPTTSIQTHNDRVDDLFPSATTPLTVQLRAHLRKAA